MNRRNFLGSIIGLFTTKLIINQPFIAELFKEKPKDEWFVNLMAADAKLGNYWIMQEHGPIYELKGVPSCGENGNSLEFMEFNATHSLYIPALRFYRNGILIFESAQNVAMANGDSLKITLEKGHPCFSLSNVATAQSD